MSLILKLFLHILCILTFYVLNKGPYFKKYLPSVILGGVLAAVMWAMQQYAAKITVCRIKTFDSYDHDRA